MKKFLSKNWKNILIILLLAVCGYFFISGKISNNKITKLETQIEKASDSIDIINYALSRNAIVDSSLRRIITDQEATIKFQIEEYNKLASKHAGETEILIHMNTPESIKLLENNLQMELTVVRDSMVELPPIATKKINKVFLERNQANENVVALENRIT